MTKYDTSLLHHKKTDKYIGDTFTLVFRWCLECLTLFFIYFSLNRVLEALYHLILHY